MNRKFVIGERKLVYMAKYSTPQVIYKMLVETVKYHFITSKSEVLKLTASAD